MKIAGYVNLHGRHHLSNIDCTITDTKYNTSSLITTYYRPKRMGLYDMANFSVIEFFSQMERVPQNEGHWIKKLLIDIGKRDKHENTF